MDQGTISIFFALLRSAIRGTRLTGEEIGLYSDEKLADLIQLSKKHDVLHLLALGLQQNDLMPQNDDHLGKSVFKAVYRYEQLNYEFGRLCETLESAKIAFLPLKGSVLRKYYPEPWMRTSCDIDILVHPEDLETAISHLVEALQYEDGERATHDVSLYSPSGQHVELHFDLLEEGRANHAVDILKSVWDYTSLHDGTQYRYEMSDAFFYFYHVAHMAKHFEGGGCGIRSLIDLWLLERIDDAAPEARDALLEQGGLLKFANAARALAAVWLEGAAMSDRSLRMQDYILQAGIYGSMENRVALQQKKKGGKLGYIRSRLFVPYVILKRYYPILEKHRWLMPLMQVRRWFMLLNPRVAKRVKREMSINGNVERARVEELNSLLTDLNLH